MFPISEFESIQTELVNYTKAAKQRLKRYRKKPAKSPHYKFMLQSQIKNYRDFTRIDAVLDSYQGEFEIFTFFNPLVSHKSHNGLYLHQNASRGNQSIVVGGFAVGELDAVAAGDFLQINGSKKAYRILADADANASGQVTVQLTQALIQDYLSPSVIKYGDDVEFQGSMIDRDSDATEASKSKWGSHYVEVIEQL